jgi:hypothetical protein
MTIIDILFLVFSACMLSAAIWCSVELAFDPIDEGPWLIARFFRLVTRKFL